MIYRFRQVIILPDGSKNQEYDPIIVDGDLDKDNPTHVVIQDAIDKGLLVDFEPKNVPIKQKTQSKK